MSYTNWKYLHNDDEYINNNGGSDHIVAFLGNNNIETGNGNDHVRIWGGDNTVDTGKGDDWISTSIGNDIIKGGAGNDTIYGGSGNNQIWGGLGHDYILTLHGNDVVYGGSGWDQIRTGGGDDVIWGGSGSDYIWAGSGNDIGHYVFADNQNGECDYYDGSLGCHDKLCLHLTPEELSRPDVQADIANLQQHIACGLSCVPFCFTSTGLTVVNWECVEIKVTGPIAVDDTADTTQTAAVTVDVLANDKQKSDGQTLTLVKADVPADKGTVEVNPDGTIKFVAADSFKALLKGQSETVEIPYTIKNENGDTATATLTVTVEGANDNPVLKADNISIKASEVKGYIQAVLENDSVIDAGDSLTLVSVTKLAGEGDVSVDPATGKVTFNGANFYQGLLKGETKTFEYEYTVKNSRGETFTQKNVITINGELVKTNLDNGKTYATNEDAGIYSMDVLGGLKGAAGETFSVVSAKDNSKEVDVQVNGTNITFDTNAYNHLQAATGNGTGASSAAFDVTYTVQSSFGYTQEVTKQVTVEGRNDAPVVESQTVKATSGSLVHSSAAHLVGKSVVTADKSAIQLTSADRKQIGAVWENQKVDLTKSFELKAQINFGSKGDVEFFGNKVDVGADGVAFVLQNASQGLNAISTQTGESLGYVGLDNAFAVEFDTYTNAGIKDLEADHVGFSTDGTAETKNTTAITDAAGQVLDIADGKYHDVKIVWDSAAQKTTVYFDGKEITSHTGDIKAIVGGNEAYIGFTAATGDNVNAQLVKNVSYKTTSDEPLSMELKATDADTGDKLSIDWSTVKLTGNGADYGQLIFDKNNNTVKFDVNESVTVNEAIKVGVEYAVKDDSGAANASSAIQTSYFEISNSVTMFDTSSVVV